MQICVIAAVRNVPFSLRVIAQKNFLKIIKLQKDQKTLENFIALLENLLVTI
jgi:hypothetical protein